MVAPSLSAALLTRRRLAAQRLRGAPYDDAATLVRELGAVQSQDYAGAKWALAMRLPADTTEARLDAAFDRGEFLRTHVLRPTWHFVTPEDIRWMIALTGPRILSGTAQRRRDLELDAPTLDRAVGALERALRGGHSFTREAVREALARARVAAADTERFTHIMMFAELQSLVCSGVRQGAQTTTYALLDERAPASGARRLSRDDAVCELVRRYFTTHGPATLHDFVVWSGLTIADARLGLEAHGDVFRSATLDGRVWWFAADGDAPPRASGARLLPNYDEYFIGFKHRDPLLARLAADGAALGARALLAHLIEIDGQLVGGWRRVARGKQTTVELSPVVPLTTPERRAVEREVGRLGRYLGAGVTASWQR